MDFWLAEWLQQKTEYIFVFCVNSKGAGQHQPKTQEKQGTCCLGRPNGLEGGWFPAEMCAETRRNEAEMKLEMKQNSIKKLRQKRTHTAETHAHRAGK